MSTCLHCKTVLTADRGFYEITRQPSGDRWRVCSLECMAKFVAGSPS